MNQKLPTTADVVANLQNIQIYPATQRVEINDKFTKVVFNTTFNNSDSNGIIEKKNFKSRKGNSTDIITRYQISNPDQDVINLTEFDRAVLSACISEQKKGNLYTTVNIIFRALVGKYKQAEAGVYPKKNQKAAIIKALKFLMATIVDFKNIDESFAQLGYLAVNENFKLKSSSILPAAFLDCKINGQPVQDVIYFDRTSPLLERAEKLNQIVRYPSELLDVPNQNNTPLIIMLKNYILRRVAEIKLHKQLTPTITFDDVFTKCRISDANRHVQFDARSEILKLFQHLKNQNFISDFETFKRGVSVSKIAFSFNHQESY